MSRSLLVRLRPAPISRCHANRSIKFVYCSNFGLSLDTSWNHNPCLRYTHTLNPSNKTYLRPRRLLPKAQSYLRFDHADSSVYATPPETGNSRRRQKPGEKFQFTHIFSQDDELRAVYKTSCHPLILRLVNGQDSLLFTLGVTGSGKVSRCLQC
jgi:hypothetical protein